MKYGEVFGRLTYELAAIVFLKKDGKIRVMLGTRNLRTAELEYGFLGQQLGGRDRNCNIDNGNIALIDMVIGEVRSFNIERLLSIDFLGEVRSKEEYDRVYKDFIEFKEEYEASKPMELTMDTFDIKTQQED